MENNSFFEETQANTMECLNQIVVTNHNRQQEIKKWIEQAIHSGKMEYVVAVAEGIPLEKLSNIAKLCLEEKNRSVIEQKIYKEALRVAHFEEEPILVNSNFVFVTENTENLETQTQTEQNPVEVNEEQAQKETSPKKQRKCQVAYVLDTFDVSGVQFTLTAKPYPRKQQKSMVNKELKQLRAERSGQQEMVR